MSAFPDSHFLAGCLGSRCRHSERFSAPTDHLQPRSRSSKFWCWSSKKNEAEQKKMRLNDFFSQLTQKFDLPYKANFLIRRFFRRITSMTRQQNSADWLKMKTATENYRLAYFSVRIWQVFSSGGPYFSSDSVGPLAKF